MRRMSDFHFSSVIYVICNCQLRLSLAIESFLHFAIIPTFCFLLKMLCWHVSKIFTCITFWILFSFDFFLFFPFFFCYCCRCCCCFPLIPSCSCFTSFFFLCILRMLYSLHCRHLLHYLWSSVRCRRRVTLS